MQALVVVQHRLVLVASYLGRIHRWGYPLIVDLNRIVYKLGQLVVAHMELVVEVVVLSKLGLVMVLR